MDLVEIVAEFRRDHKRYTDSEYEEGTGRLIKWEGCEQCDHEGWPCPTIALCDAYEALAAQEPGAKAAYSRSPTVKEG